MDRYRHLTHQQLIEAITGGDKHAAAYLMTQVLSENFHYLIRKFQDAQLEYDELVNEVYIHFQEDNWLVLKSFRGDSGASLATYLQVVVYRFILRKYISKGLKESRRIMPLNELAREIADPGMEAQQRKVELLEMIRHLKNDRERMVLRLHLLGLKPSEIGERLKVSSNAVTILKSRGLEHLQELFKSKRV